MKWYSNDRLTCLLFSFDFRFVPNILFKIILQRAVEVWEKWPFPLDWMLGKMSVEKKALPDFDHFHTRWKEMFVVQISEEGNANDVNFHLNR